MTGPVALLAICVTTAAVGIAVASWGFARRGSDAALAASMSGLAYLFLPVHALGWLGWLTRGSLTTALAALAVAVIAPTLAWSAARARWIDTARVIARAGVDAVREPIRSRSVASVGVVAVVALSAWTAGVAYLTASTSWDGLAYHEPMIALALQNHGFEWVGWGSASQLLSQVDGFPRLVENLMLVAAVAWDRRVVDVVPSALLPVLVLAVYALLRRFVRSRVLALGLACGFALLPSVALELRSTMVDLAFAACCAASFAWAARRDPSVAEIWQLGLSLGLLGASKVTGLFVLPFAIGVAVVAVLRGSGRRRRLAHLAGALLLCAAMTAPTYVRNVTETGNPLWPARVDVLGVHLPGSLQLVDQNLDAEQTWNHVSTVGRASHYHPGARRGSYGYAPLLLLPPLALLGLWLALGRAGVDARSQTLLAVAVPLVAFFAISPARDWARLNLHAVLGAFVLAGYWLGQPGRRRFAHGALAVLLVGSLAFLAYSHPHWAMPLEDVAARAGWPSTRRAADPVGTRRLLPYELAIARETELGRGDLVVVERAGWLGLYWNERFDNRVEHLDSASLEPDAWIDEAARLGAEWVVVGRRGPLVEPLLGTRCWQVVGFTRRTLQNEAIFRRDPSCPGAGWRSRAVE